MGKSTITFHLATRYAQLHPKQKVLVIDLCPQSNSSMMLLGGGGEGEKKVLSFCTRATPKTVVGYLSAVIAGGAGAPLPDSEEFMTKVSRHNKNIPSNLFLVSGDGNLEPMAPAINRAADAPSLTPSSNPWLWIHRIFHSMVANLVKDDSADWMVFVDTNPSFSIYTEIAVSTAGKLIVPVNADDSSRVATNAMFVLLHGMTPPHPIYGSWTYAQRAINAKLPVPLVHLIVGNRLTQYGGAATAFEALSDATADTLFLAYQNHPRYFTARPAKVGNVANFRAQFSVALRDFNTAGVVSAHLGRPMSLLKQGYHPVHNSEVKVDAEQVRMATQAIDQIIRNL